MLIPVLLISPLAQAAQQQGGSPWVMIGPIVIFAVMLFFLFRSQSKENKKKQKMLEEIKSGDRVVTICGIHGVIANVKEKTFMLKIADNVKVEINKSGVASVINSKELAKNE